MSSEQPGSLEAQQTAVAGAKEASADKPQSWARVSARDLMASAGESDESQSKESDRAA